MYTIVKVKVLVYNIIKFQVTCNGYFPLDQAYNYILLTFNILKVSSMF